MLRSLRSLLIAWEVLLVAGALALLWSGFAWAPLILIYALVNAAIIGLAVFLERPRYRSDAEDADGRPGRSEVRLPPGFAPTEELFIDPTSGVRVRVWIDPATGERRYRPESR
jgi:hypothetical protein